MPGKKKSTHAAGKPKAKSTESLDLACSLDIINNPQGYLNAARTFNPAKSSRPGAAFEFRGSSLPANPHEEVNLGAIPKRQRSVLTFTDEKDSEADERAQEEDDTELEIKQINNEMAQYRMMMDKGPGTREVPLAFFKKLMRLGLNHQEISIRQRWEGIEPTATSLLATKADYIAGLITSIMPCSLGEVCTYIHGLGEGTRLNTRERLDQLEQQLSDLCDSMKVVALGLEKSYLAHIDQAAQFAQQVNHSSASLANSVHDFEKMMLNISHNLLKMPIVTATPSVHSLETSQSTQRAPKKPSVVPKRPSLLDVPEVLKKTTLVTNIEKDGVYQSAIASVTIKNQIATSVTVTRGEWKFLHHLRGTKVKLVSWILSAPAAELANFETENPGWLEAIMTLSGTERAEFLKTHFRQYRDNPAQWTFTPIDP